MIRTTPNDKILSPLSVVLLIGLFFVMPIWADADQGQGVQSTSSGQQAQMECPVMVGNKVDPNIYTVYQDKKVFFCCLFCKANFEKNPEKYLPGLPQFASIRAESQVGDGHGDYDNATGHEQPHGASRLIRFVGKFHPVATHFPIALIVAACLAEALAFVTKRDFFRNAARFSLLLGAIGGVVAASLGWAAGAFANYPPEFSGTLSLHRWLGTATAVLLVVAAVLCEGFHRRGNRGAGIGYRIILGLSVALVGLTGNFGGVLVYGSGYYSW